RGLPGSLELRLAGDDVARSALWGAGAGEESGLHGGRSSGHRAGNRDEHRYFFRAERSRAEAPAGSKSGTDCQCRPDIPWKAQRNEHGEPGLFSYAEYKNYRANNHVFSGLLAYAPFLGGVPLEGENPKGLMGAETSCNFFDVLGERPSLGRTFVEADCRAPGG